ncbi:MAG: glycosyltransferase [Rhodothermia bacterium]|nr:glycosyltransferase [Rhodothermia bacterium]
MKRVLLISYYFPPSGGPGVQRTLKFVRYLPDFGWKPTVLTVDAAHAAYPDIDATLEEEVPADVDVVRTKAWDPYGGYARLTGREKADSIGVSFVSDQDRGWREHLARWVRANVFVPDARVGWVPFAVRRAIDLTRESSFDAVVTTGPPHSTHLVGRSVARRTGLPWLADFRDPWTGVFYYADLPATAISRRLDRRLEATVLSEADVVTVVSPSMEMGLRERVDRKYECVPNGFDPLDFKSVEVRQHPTRFVIRHVGNLGPSQNSPVLWRSIAGMPGNVVSEVSPAVEFVGNVDNGVVASAKSAGLGEHISVTGYVSHEAAIQRMAEAAVLLLVIPDVPQAGEIVTGKIYEYIASGRPILAIGPPDGDAGRILDETGSGRMFARDDATGIEAFLMDELKRFREEGLEPRTLSPAALKYDRRNLTSHFAGLLSGIAGDRG